MRILLWMIYPHHHHHHHHHHHPFHICLPLHLQEHQHCVKASVPECDGSYTCSFTHLFFSLIPLFCPFISLSPPAGQRAGPTLLWSSWLTSSTTASETHGSMRSSTRPSRWSRCRHWWRSSSPAPCSHREVSLPVNHSCEQHTQSWFCQSKHYHWSLWLSIMQIHYTDWSVSPAPPPRQKIAIRKQNECDEALRGEFISCYRSARCSTSLSNTTILLQ